MGTRHPHVAGGCAVADTACVVLCCPTAAPVVPAPKPSRRHLLRPQKARPQCAPGPLQAHASMCLCALSGRFVSPGSPQRSQAGSWRSCSLHGRRLRLRPHQQQPTGSEARCVHVCVTRLCLPLGGGCQSPLQTIRRVSQETSLFAVCMCAAVSHLRKRHTTLVRSCRTCITAAGPCRSRR